jgi:hypothetical protein
MLNTIVNGIGSFLGRECGRCGSRSDDHGHVASDQLGRQFRKAFVPIVRPTVLDRHILSFDMAGFVQTLPESLYALGIGFGRSRAEKSNHRCRLLCVRCEWPRHWNAAKQRDELAPSDADCHATLSCNGGDHITT